MNGLYTIILLILSNVFMTLAWYGHLKLQASGISAKWPMIGVILFHGVLHSLNIAVKFLQIASDSKTTEAPLILYNLKLFKNV